MNLQLALRSSLLAALLGLGASGPVIAQEAATCPPTAKEPSPAEIPDLVKGAKDHGFLWKATKGGKTSYLYGTIHVGKVAWMFPGPATTEAVKASDAIALELDMMDPAIMARLQAGMAPQPGHVLPEKLNARLRAQLKAACLPEQLLTAMSPEMVTTMLSTLVGRRDGLDPSFGVDTVYAGMGRGLNKPVSSLETPELQLKLLLGKTAQETQELVESALTELESGKAGPMLKKMAQAWADGRLADLENYEKWCECMDTEKDRDLMRRMLDDRNPGLADGIDKLHASGKTVFVAVGSLHMAGKTGLPALLEKRGYIVERVAFKP